nr:hypothetical protein Iba_chr11fCG3870 [Ipomoea batatas]
MLVATFQCTCMWRILKHSIPIKHTFLAMNHIRFGQLELFHSPTLQASCLCQESKYLLVLLYFLHHF